MTPRQLIAGAFVIETHGAPEDIDYLNVLPLSEHPAPNWIVRTASAALCDACAQCDAFRARS